MDSSREDTDSNYSEPEILLTDICNKSNKKIQYFKVTDNLDRIKIITTNITTTSNFHSFNSLIKDIFLPKGFPESVSNDYLEYQIWDTCQAFCSSICGTLTVKAVMEGIGVGSKAATPVSAAITWIMKDGTGMLGSILFTWLKGSKLDSDCKKWRLFADILNDIAMFIELFIPRVIDYSMHMLCVATAFKALVGTAGSSTRAAITTHQAIRGNIADVSAKDGSQELCTNLIAFVFGILLLKNITNADQVWILMCTAASLHLFFNYKAVRCLRMNVFNAERLRLCLRTYLPTSTVPTVEQVNRREPVCLGKGSKDVQLCGFAIHFGVSVHEVIKAQNTTGEHLSSLVNIFQSQKYFILAHLKKKILHVAFRSNFTPNDVLKAYFHSFVVGIALSFLRSSKTLLIAKRSRKNSPIYRLKNILDESLEDVSFDKDDTVILKTFTRCEDFIEKEFSAFCNLCAGEGWDVNKHLINIDEWRADWKFIDKPPETPKKRAVVEESSYTKARTQPETQKCGLFQPDYIIASILDTITKNLYTCNHGRTVCCITRLSQSMPGLFSPHSSILH